MDKGEHGILEGRGCGIAEDKVYAFAVHRFVVLQVIHHFHHRQRQVLFAVIPARLSNQFFEKLPVQCLAGTGKQALYLGHRESESPILFVISAEEKQRVGSPQKPAHQSLIKLIVIFYTGYVFQDIHYPGILGRHL